MGLRDRLKTESDDDDADDKPAITISPPQPLQQHRYGEFGKYHQRFQPSQQHQQQQERRKTPPPRPPRPAPLETPDFTFSRSDVLLPQDLAQSPGDSALIQSDDPQSLSLQTSATAGHDRLASPTSPQGHRLSFGMFRKSPSRSSRSSRSASISSSIVDKSDGAVESKAHRLSNRLRLSRTPSTSFHVPANLPEIVVSENEGDDSSSKAMQMSSVSLSSQTSSTSNSRSGAAALTSTHSRPAPPSPAVEFQWEKRATMLAKANERQQQRSSNSIQPSPPEERLGSPGSSQTRANHSPSNPADGSDADAKNDGTVSSKELDATIQEAIRLHEEGKLEQSTRMFGILADPRGYNNPLSQVLYGLALRHGWGCPPDTETAVKYLSAAASNAAVVEDMALQAGMNKGGAAKGELVLAIFELANCFRHGWGLERDPIAAKQYYETAANLGDTGM
ncbi:hypothetical protein SEPCBS57363_005496 [Sporothrix epigloea]|uniref:Uncharacterized protein n=1 Tax=Sporothrix epigloea TaxID=1892477 RepID=A0ABP0DXV4_9PEZI